MSRSCAGKSAKKPRLDPAVCADVAAQCACQQFRRASRAVTQLFDDILAPSGLRSTQVIVLVAIAAAEPASPARLARELGMDASTLTRTLATLARMKLVAKRREKGANRISVSLTESGAAAVEEATPLWKAAQDQFVSAFGRERWPDLSGDLGAAASAAGDAAR